MAHDTKHITFIRHGESISSPKGIRQHNDEGLSEKGKLQAELAAKRFGTDGIECDFIFTSPYERTKETAATISQTAHCGVEVLNEAHERKTPSSLMGVPMQDPKTIQVIEDIFKLWVTDPDAKYEDGESYNELMGRVHTVQRFLESSEHKNIVVVSHATFTKAFLSSVLHADNHTPEVLLAIYHTHEIANTSLTHFSYTPNKGWKLVTWNDHGHLAKLGRA